MIKIRKSEKYLEGMTFIDLFAGIGGFRLALESLGAECVYSNEWDKYAQETYKENFGEIPEGDITKVSEKTIPDHDILCAGFPCQSFSISGKQQGFADTRGTLFFDVARIVREKKPKIVFMENVKNFAAHDGGRTLLVIQKTMEQLGYSFNYKVLNSANFGAATARERCYMVCFRNDLDIDLFAFPDGAGVENKCVKDILLDNEKEVAPYYVKRNDMVFTRRDIRTPVNHPVQLGYVSKGRQGERIYSIKGTAITLSANGGGAFAKTGGYLVKSKKVRKLHPRECARAMGFPDSFKYHPRPMQAHKQFGNSVVVDVLQFVARAFGKAYRDKYPKEK